MSPSFYENVEKWTHFIVPAFLLLCAIGNGIVALVLHRKLKNRYRHYLKTEGVVSGIVKEKGSDGEMIYPMVKFTASAKEYEVKNGYGRSPWDIKPGDSVPILYNQNNPAEVEIENKVIHHLLPHFFTAGSILALICVPVTYFLMKRM